MMKKIAFTLLLIAVAITAHAEKKVKPNADHDGIQFRGFAEAVKFDVSPPLYLLRSGPFQPTVFGREGLEERPSGLEGPYGHQDVDLSVQKNYYPVGTDFPIPAIPAPSTTFAGPPDNCGCQPPDPNGDIGPTAYVATVNSQYAIYSRTGTQLKAPTNINTIWSGFGGACQTENAGDPVVLYDSMADRWLITQFTAAGPTYFNCVALSQTGDPLGSYYRWAFTTGSNFPDYPKYGVWPDGYYISTREFAGAPFAGDGAYALERAQMLVGNPAARSVSFLLTPSPSYRTGDGILPADFDGERLPPANSPEFYIGTQDNGGPYSAPSDALNLYKYSINWVAGTGTFTGPTVIGTSAFDSIFGTSTCTSMRKCIPQPGTSNKVDHQGYRQRVMHKVAYRNFAGYDSLVTNQSVEAVSGMSGIRWWEIRNPNAVSPTLAQDSTYCPGCGVGGDGIHRWFGSIAQDNGKNMALGYSSSNGTSPNFPSVKYTGRLSSDTVNTMPQGEGTVQTGVASQTSGQRWGDYSSMSVDPLDDCSFWYFNEDIASGGAWQTHVGKFKFTQCTSRGAGEPSPIKLSKSGGNLVITWTALGAECGGSDYAVYKGNTASLSSGYTHQQVACTTNKTASFTMAMPSDTNAYFLVTSESAFDEGSYGRNSANVERPTAGVSACKSIQSIGACPSQ